MYSSDYGYATSGYASTTRNECLSKSLDKLSDFDDCINNNYLFNGLYEWTLTVSYIYADLSYYIGYSGYVNHNGSYHIYNVRPTLFLKSDISIGVGDGTEVNPYQLNI